MLEPVGIFTIAPVSGASGWLDVRHVPRFRPENTEKSSGIERAGTLFRIIGLLDDAALFCPLALQGEDKNLKCHAGTSELGV